VAARVAVVTDSTACLSSELIAKYHIRAVPLSVVVGDRRLDDDAAELPGRIEAELRSGAAIRTASPAPERFAAAYAAAAAAGAEAIVSVHLSGRMSGTVGSARLAAAAAAVPVRVIDSGSLGMGLGFAVLSAAEVAGAGGSVEQAAGAAARRSARLRSFFTVDTPGRLQAGGRLGAGAGAGAAPGAGPGVGAGSADPGLRLTARPVLHISDGQLVQLEKVRTRSAAVRRLTELAVESAAIEPVDLAVQYLGHADRVPELAGRLAELVPGAREIYQVRADAVIGVHAGQGMLGVVVAPYASSDGSHAGC
jgi:fatty acid-binding protein DegV